MINKRVIRHNFNMVEIMLAVIVIALGLTSTFVLFPVGLNATKDAIAENHIADASEAIITNIHTSILPEILDGAGANHAFKSSLSDCFYDPDNVTEKVKKYIDDGVEGSEGTEGTEVSNGLFKLDKGVYLLNYDTTGESNQQPVLATIKLDTSGFENEYFYTKDNGFQPYSNLSSADKCIDKFLLPIIIEVSWPAHLPSSEREKRIFRYEMFNTEYEPPTSPGA